MKNNVNDKKIKTINGYAVTEFVTPDTFWCPPDMIDEELRNLLFGKSKNKKSQQIKFTNNEPNKNN